MVLKKWLRSQHQLPSALDPTLLQQPTLNPLYCSNLSATKRNQTCVSGSTKLLQAPKLWDAQINFGLLFLHHGKENAWLQRRGCWKEIKPRSWLFALHKIAHVRLPFDRVPHTVTCRKILLTEFISICCGMSLTSCSFPHPSCWYYVTKPNKLFKVLKYPALNPLEIFHILCSCRRYEISGGPKTLWANSLAWWLSNATLTYKYSVSSY